LVAPEVFWWQNKIMTKHEIDILLAKVRKSSGDEMWKSLLDCCSEVVARKEQEHISEEDAAYDIVGIVMWDYHNFPGLYALFDIAADTEIPCDAFKEEATEQGMTIDAYKQDQWRRVVEALARAVECVK